MVQIWYVPWIHKHLSLCVFARLACWVPMSKPQVAEFSFWSSLKKMLVWWLCRFQSDLSSPCERLTVRCAFSRQRLPVWPFCQQHSRPIPGVPTVNETKLNNIKRHGHHYISKFVMLCNALILFHFFGFVLIHQIYQIIKVYLKLGAWLEDLCARRSLSILAQLWLTSTPPAS